MKPKIIRAATVPMSIEAFVLGMLGDLTEKYEVVLLSSDGPEWENIDSTIKDAAEKKEYARENAGGEQNDDGVRCIKVNMERHISLMSDVKSLWKLWRVFRKEKPQMVHSMTPKAGLLCMMAAKFAGVPVRVHTFTGLVFPTATGIKKKILMATDKLTCACATHIIPEGEGVKNDLLNNGITKKDIKVLGYGNCKGIDLERFKPSQTSANGVNQPLQTISNGSEILALHGIPSGAAVKSSQTTFIAVGRLVGDKGINEMVEAFVRLNKEHTDTRLILVGPEEAHLDPLKPETSKIIHEHQDIYAVGSQSDVRPWFASSDVAILASYREGFPNVVIEAGAMGLPQIVTNINGANEIIVEGKNGTIIPSKDADALYEAMKRMLNKEYRDSLAKNAREMIASRYDQKFVRKCLLDFYDSIMPICR